MALFTLQEQKDQRVICEALQWPSRLFTVVKMVRHGLHTHTRWSEKILYHEKFQLHAPKLVNLSGSNWHQVGHTWTLGRVLAVAKHVSGDTSGLFTASHQQRQSKSSPKPLSEMHTHKAVWSGPESKCNVRSTKATEKANTQLTANWPDIKQRTVGVSGDIQTT